jgi:hypothetical protein
MPYAFSLCAVRFALGEITLTVQSAPRYNHTIKMAGVVKLVDALDSKSSGLYARASSTLASGTK